MTSKAERLYATIASDEELVNSLFCQALNDLSGTIARIQELGRSHQIDLSVEEIKAFVQQLPDPDTRRWVEKARGGL